MRPSSAQNTCSESVEPTGSKRLAPSSLCCKLPECAITHSRRPQARWNGCVFASVNAPHMAVRMWTRKIDDSRRSHADTSALRIDPWGGAASLSTSAAGSPSG